MASVICVTGAETTVAALARRVAEIPAGLHEVRADHLRSIDDDLFALVEQAGPRLLFCCRSRAQGGQFSGSEAERLTLLRRAHRARYVDLEHDVPLEGFDPSRLVLSWHDFSGPSEVVERAEQMSPRGAAVVKLAVRVEDAADIALLQQARRHIDGQAVLIGMGAAGLLSRVRYRALGSQWTYVAADPELTTAPGQLDWSSARAMGLPETADRPFCALVGGPQVFASPGARVYNALYRARGWALSYLPIVTRSLAACLPVLESLGARGLSATMPLKLEALELCAADALAREIGSVNSLRRGATGWEGTNTDAEGVRAPLEAAAVGGTALILGAGGAARAAAHACRSLGLEVVVSARSARGLDTVVPWEERAGVHHDVLINATPIAGTDSPWPDAAPLADCVFDLAIAPTSALLERAAREGRRGIDAKTMWLHQGARQMSWMLDEPVSPAELQEHL